MIPESPKLLAERDAKLAALGPRPSWWRPLRRRAWIRHREAVLAMGVSQFDEMLRHWYGDEHIERVAAQRPMFGTTRMRR